MSDSFATENERLLDVIVKLEAENNRLNAENERLKKELELKTESPNEAVLRLFKMWLHRKLEEDGCNMENISETKVNWDDWNEVSFCLWEKPKNGESGK